MKAFLARMLEYFGKGLRIMIAMWIGLNLFLLGLAFAVISIANIITPDGSWWVVLVSSALAGACCTATCKLVLWSDKEWQK